MPDLRQNPAGMDRRMTPNIPEIARALTKAQRERLEALYQLRAHGKVWMSRHGSAYLSCAKASSLKLVELGLVEARGREVATTGRVMSHGIGWLTPLGLAVRQWILEQEAGRQ